MHSSKFQPLKPLDCIYLDVIDLERIDPIELGFFPFGCQFVNNSAFKSFRSQSKGAYFSPFERN